MNIYTRFIPDRKPVDSLLFLGRKMKGRSSQFWNLLLSFLNLFFLLVDGCSYPISRDLMKLAEKNLTYPIATQNLKEYVGSTILWGGIISDLHNGKDGAQITVLETPLDRRGLPQFRTTRGMFIARMDENLDPKVYQKGKGIALAGNIIGQETKPLGDMKYAYPVIHVLELHLWQEGELKSLENFEAQEYEWYRDADIPHLWPFEEDPGEGDHQ